MLWQYSSSEVFGAGLGRRGRFLKSPLPAKRQKLPLLSNKWPLNPIHFCKVLEPFYDKCRQRPKDSVISAPISSLLTVIVKH